MNLVLTQDVKHLGMAGDIVRVAIGYARNFLLPKGLANIATPAEMGRAEKIRAERVARKEEIMKNTSEVADKLDGVTVTFRKKVSSGNKLFGGIAEVDIAEAIKKQAKVEVEKSHIHLPHGHIKTSGDHEIDVHLYEGKHVKITVKVEAE